MPLSYWPIHLTYSLAVSASIWPARKCAGALMDLKDVCAADFKLNVIESDDTHMQSVYHASSVMPGPVIITLISQRETFHYSMTINNVSFILGQCPMKLRLAETCPTFLKNIPD